MDPKDYCVTMHAELLALKVKIYEIYRATECLPQDLKTRLTGPTSELHSLMEELTVKVNEFKKTCPYNGSSITRSLKPR